MGQFHGQICRQFCVIDIFFGQFLAQFHGKFLQLLGGGGGGISLAIFGILF